MERNLPVWTVAVGALGTVFAAIIGAIVATRHRRTDERTQARRLVQKYRDPLVASAFDLQSRFYNILEQQFLGKYLTGGTDEEQKYAVQSTLFVIAEFFGWIELLRLEVQFLDFGKSEQTRTFGSQLDAVRRAFWEDKTDRTFRLFRGQQRAVGEMMIASSAPASQRTCIGFATFVSRLEDPGFARWFDQLEKDVHNLATGAVPKDRLVAIQHALIDLLEFFDSEHDRLPMERRKAPF